MRAFGLPRRGAASLLLAVATVLVSTILSAAPAAASPPESVSIEVNTTIPPSGPTFGPFVASGPAVDAGIVCATGTTVDLDGQFVGYQSGRAAQILAIKEFTCDDGSGTFLVLLRVSVSFSDFSATFSWSVRGGTGAYEGLHGAGQGTGLGTETEDSVLDTYSGAMHRD